MLPTFGQKLEQGARRLVPLGTVLLFVLGEVVAWPLPSLGAVTPALGLMAVYYWAVHRPDLLKVWAVFLLGVLHDAIHGLPLGLSALLFVAAYQLVQSQRRFFVGQMFLMLWAGFALTALLVMLGQGLVFALYSGRWIAWTPVLLQMVLTVVLFPLPAWLLIRLQRGLLSTGER